MSSMYDNILGSEENTERVLDQLNIANIEEKDSGLIGYINIDRKNAKYITLLSLLVLKDPEIQAELTALSQDPNASASKFDAAKKLLEDVLGKATFRVFTNPYRGCKNINCCASTIINQFKENHMLGTLLAVLIRFPRKFNNEAQLDINITFPRIAQLEKVLNNDVNVNINGDVQDRYDHNNAVDAILNEIVDFYNHDSLVSEVVGAIRSGDQNSIKLLKKRIISLLSSKIETKEVVVNNTKVIEEVVRCGVNGPNEDVKFIDDDTKKKHFIKSITVGGIKLKRENIMRQHTVIDDDGYSVKNIRNEDNKPIFFRQLNPEGRMCRYSFNSETGFLFEFPDVDFDQIDENTKIRIFDGVNWFDSYDNAVCSKFISLEQDETIKREGFVCSFYDQNKKQCVQCSPFSKKVCISNYAGNNEISVYKDVGGVRNFNKRLDSLIESIESGSLKSEKNIRTRIKGLGIAGLVYNNPWYISKNSNSKVLDILKMIRRYGVFNMISPFRPKKEDSSLKSEDLEHDFGIANPENNHFWNSYNINNAENNFSRTGILNRYGYDVGEEDRDDKNRSHTKRSLMIERMLCATRPKNIVVEEYEGGKKKGSKVFKQEEMQKEEIKNSICNGFVFGNSPANTCNYAEKILKKAQEAGIDDYSIEREYENNSVYVSDLSKEAYGRYKKFKKTQEDQEEQRNKIVKPKPKKNTSTINKQIEQNVINQSIYSINSSLSLLKRIANREKGFFEQILFYLFGRVNKKELREYNDSINTLKRNLKTVPLNGKNLKEIKKIVDLASLKVGKEIFNINNYVTISLDSLKKAKGI